MGTCSFREIREVCKRLGLSCCPKKKGEEWKGLDANGKLLSIILHEHAAGRDIPDGTFHTIIKQLCFTDEEDFKGFLTNKKRTR